MNREEEPRLSVSPAPSAREAFACSLVAGVAFLSWQLALISLVVISILRSVSFLKSPAGIAASLMWAAALFQGSYRSLLFLIPAHWFFNLTTSILISYFSIPITMGIRGTNALIKERQRRGQEHKGEETTPPVTVPACEPDPYAILGLNKGASREAIQAEYRRQLMLYHPDKVQHLGAELQVLAHEKTLQIQKAFKMLLA